MIVNYPAKFAFLANVASVKKSSRTSGSRYLSASIVVVADGAGDALGAYGLRGVVSATRNVGFDSGLGIYG